MILNSIFKLNILLIATIEFVSTKYNETSLEKVCKNSDSIYRITIIPIYIGIRKRPVQIEYHDFKNFSEINLNCLTDETYFIQRIYFTPKYKLIMDNQLDLNVKNEANSAKVHSTLLLFAADIKGFDIGSHLFEIKHPRHQKTTANFFTQI